MFKFNCSHEIQSYKLSCVGFCSFMLFLFLGDTGAKGLEAKSDFFSYIYFLHLLLTCDLIIVIFVLLVAGNAGYPGSPGKE